MDHHQQATINMVVFPQLYPHDQCTPVNTPEPSQPFDCLARLGDLTVAIEHYDSLHTYWQQRFGMHHG